jgi:hypothetical protein
MEDFYCKNGACEQIATYGYNSAENIFCKDCALDDMIITFEKIQFEELDDYEIKKNRKCNYSTCDKYASYNFPHIKSYVCCFKHILSGMIDVKHQKCTFKGCHTIPSYNFECQKKPIRCSKHIEEGMIDISSKMCIICLKVCPCYNYPDQEMPLYCKACADNDMINVKDINRKCECGKHRPSFGYPDDEIAKYCSECKLVGMKNIINKKCVCGLVYPSFNYDGLKPKYCAKCKLPEMIYVYANMCIVCNKIQASFNYENEQKPSHCNTCKLPDMVDIKHIKCECGKYRPSFNYPDNEIAKYCSECKLVGMENIINKKCVCGLVYPSFNYDGLKPKYCAKCKLPEMICVYANMCIVCNKIRASFNYENEQKPSHCNTCKLPDMIDIIHKFCKNDWCKTRANPQSKYENYCVRCFIYQYPEKKISKNYKIKERHVTDFIEEHFKGYPIILDKRVNGGCSKRRPDIYIDMLTHIIIIEIDENQHRNYDNTCEIAKINELFTDFGDRSIIFIRFNPDDYIKNDIKFQSSFKYHETLGIPMIRDNEEWNNRLQILKQCIQNHIEIIPTETTFEYLYYDS